MENYQSHLSDVLTRLKALREEYSLSIEDMAAATDKTPEEYADIEAGRGGANDISFTFLYKCAIKFGVDISSIITGTTPKLSEYTITRGGDGMPIRRNERFDYLHLAPLMKNRLAEPFMVTAKYKPELQDKPIALTSHHGQEFNQVISGKLKFCIKDHVEVLSPGDSVLYDSSEPHGMIAFDGEDCKFLSIVIKSDVNQDISCHYDHEEQAVAIDSSRYDGLCYHDYLDETFDENGILTDVKFNIPDDYNFAFDVVDRLANEKPNKRAMVWINPETGEEHTFSFADAAEYSNKAANYFLSKGVKKGDKILLVLRRHYQFWWALLGLHKIGAIAVPATDQLMAKDFIYRFNASGAVGIVCTGYGTVSEEVEKSLTESPNVKLLSMANNGGKLGTIWDDFDKGMSEASDAPLIKSNKSKEPMLMYFTSGTTGYPKIATHDYTYPIGHIVTARHWHNVNPDGVHFTVSDTGWLKALWGKLYGQWMCEGAVFVCDFGRFNPADILPMFAKYNITTFCAPPTIYRFFIKEDLSKFDLSAIEYSTTAGEALNPEVYEQWLKATGLKIHEGFGQTETTLALANLTGASIRPGAMGKVPPSYDAFLGDAEGNPVPQGEHGEICLRADKKNPPPGLFMGYYKDGEIKADNWRDGIFHTGDVAWTDEDGYFWFVGRTDDLIKSSGYRIGPFEIESVLMELPYIMECAVTGVPDEIRGQIVKATIVLTKGTEGNAELVKAIQEYVKHKTAPYKYPRVVEFVEVLPKTISGKIRRVEIRDNK
jgi:Acyl-coenzyme A synthetases/AMP-(fatty) acid ligases